MRFRRFCAGRRTNPFDVSSIKTHDPGRSPRDRVTFVPYRLIYFFAFDGIRRLRVPAAFDGGEPIDDEFSLLLNRMAGQCFR